METTFSWVFLKFIVPSESPFKCCMGGPSGSRSADPAVLEPRSAYRAADDYRLPSKLILHGRVSVWIPRRTPVVFTAFGRQFIWLAQKWEWSTFSNKTETDVTAESEVYQRNIPTGLQVRLWPKGMMWWQGFLSLCWLYQLYGCMYVCQSVQ